MDVIEIIFFDYKVGKLEINNKKINKIIRILKYFFK